MKRITYNQPTKDEIYQSLSSICSVTSRCFSPDSLYESSKNSYALPGFFSSSTCSRCLGLAGSSIVLKDFKKEDRGDYWKSRSHMLDTYKVDDQPTKTPDPLIETEKNPQTEIKKSQKMTKVIHYCDPFQDLSEDETLDSIKVNNCLTKQKVSKVEECPAAAFLAQHEAKEIVYDCRRRIPSMQPKKKTFTQRRTEVEMYLPSLHMSNGKVTFRTRQKPVVKKPSPPRVPSKVTIPEQLDKKENLTGKTDTSYTLTHSNLAKFNQMLLSTLQDLQRKVDEFIPEMEKLNHPSPCPEPKKEVHITLPKKPSNCEQPAKPAKNNPATNVKKTPSIEQVQKNTSKRDDSSFLDFRIKSPPLRHVKSHRRKTYKEMFLDHVRLDTEVDKTPETTNPKCRVVEEFGGKFNDNSWKHMTEQAKKKLLKKNVRKTTPLLTKQVEKKKLVHRPKKKPQPM